MNFALSALIIASLLLPGAAVLRAYYTSFKEKKSSIYVSTSELLVRGLVLSFVIHFLAVSLFYIVGIKIDFALLYSLLIGKQELLPGGDFAKSYLQFSGYIIVLTTVMWISSKLVKRQIQLHKIDINYYSFRNTNYWFQIFSARYLEGERIQGRQADIDLIFVDLLHKNNYIYSGFLQDFNYSPHKDELENLILRSVTKRKFQGDEEVDETDGKDGSQSSITAISESIPGDVFIIPMSQVSNINLYYISIESLVNEPGNYPAIL